MYFYTISKIDKNILYKLVDIYANAMDHLDVRKWSIKDFVELINTKSIIYYIKEDKSIMGFAIVKKIIYEAEIINISIEPAYHRNGFAKNLIKYILQSKEMKGVKRFVLEVSSENYKAKNLYENLGFKIVGYRKNYYNVKTNKYNTTKSDAEIMEYKI